MSTRSIRLEDDVDRLIVVSDLHGLVEPLEVLDDILDRLPGRAQVVAGGDYFVNGPWPAEALEWVRARAGDCAVLGNHDEGALNTSEDGSPPYREAGALGRLDASLRRYLGGLPHVLELTWRGARIRVTHDLTPCGKRVSWKARVHEVVEAMADPDVDLTVCAHTHYPFVREEGGARVANCGSVSNLLLGHGREDGGIDPKGDEDVFVPVSDIYSTYLSISIEDGAPAAKVERFQYDVDAVLQTLEGLGHPNLENLRIMYKTGVCWC